ncbi:MAG: cobalt-precorrin-5B (C(1))-methyltransferase [Rhodospirillaceae bacterium]|nr:cobalt-precorrin-5B (C(1))-methyltransferase [Rhodospirillaceae bacterium]
MKPDRPLKRGWTTGACATAAAKSAYTALLSGAFEDPVTIALPRGERVAFALARQDLAPDAATAAIVKDAGDDPDVTHGALVEATVRQAESGGVRFRAGPGVGTVTKPGLPVGPGEPAINPVPRQMIAGAIAEVAQAHGAAGDVEVEIAIPGGEKLAEKTMNGRLGIVGGLSILGTTGIVVPYSCAAWIHSIYSGIDVARATGLTHVAGATGSTSEAAVQRHYGLPESALIDMGDFVGGMLKHLRKHPVPRVTIAGGVAKMTKLAQGRLDLHSGKGGVDRAALAEVAKQVGAGEAAAVDIAAANTTALAFQIAAAEGLALGDAIAAAARREAEAVIAGTDIRIDVLIFDREGKLVGSSSP